MGNRESSAQSLPPSARSSRPTKTFSAIMTLIHDDDSRAQKIPRCTWPSKGVMGQPHSLDSLKRRCRLSARTLNDQDTTRRHPVIFPPTFSSLLQPDPTIDTALQNAFADTSSAFPNAEALSRICISLVVIDDDPLAFRSGGVRDTVTHYSASLLKVAAMFGAFQLRQSANILSFDPIDASP